MQPIDAEFRDGVLKPAKPLHLRPGERVRLVVIRKADPLRWNLDRLAQTNGDEDRSLSESGIGAWRMDLKHEDHG